MVIGGVLAIFGCFLPWIRVTSPLDEVTFSGMVTGPAGETADGPWFVAAGTAVVLIGLTLFRFGARVIGLIGLGVAGFLVAGAIVDIRDIHDSVASDPASGVLVEVGLGLYLVAIGGAIAGLSGIGAAITRA
jgi:hypothetical protein